MVPGANSQAVTVTLQLQASEVIEVNVAAASLDMTPDEWIRALLRAHLEGVPQWTAEDLGGMADAANAIKQIATLAEQDPSALGVDAGIVNEVMTAFLGRVAEASKRQRLYWGLPVTVQ